MKALNIPEDQAPALWSHRAQLRDVAATYKTENPMGVMYEWDHRRSLDWEEYEYWLYHALPFGWAVISKPMLHTRNMTYEKHGNSGAPNADDSLQNSSQQDRKH